MISSMTGFGRCENSLEYGNIRVEIKAVNHRYLDLNLRISHRLNVYENKIRNKLKSRIARGKVDATVFLDLNKDTSEEIIFNEGLATSYLDIFNTMADKFGLNNDITVSRLARFNDVLTLNEASIAPEGLWDDLNSAIDSALDEFVASRQMEGENLRADLVNKLIELSKCVDFVESKAPQIIDEYKDKLKAKVYELVDRNDVDDGRIAMEVVLFADKICVDEEIVRLKSHIDSAKSTLENMDEVGRKLDFIAQEMNREANTILSKTTDADISNTGITMKTLIEKIREQIQNLE